MIKLTIACFIAALLIIGCASNNEQQQSVDIEQIMKEMQEGRITRKEGMRKMFDSGREELEEKYRNNTISSEEYARRKVVILMDEAYEMLATSETEQHLDGVLEMSNKYNVQITRLLLYKNDGTVSFSNKQDEVGRRIDRVVDGIAVDEEGVQAGEGGEQGNFAMLRPLFNQERCKKCHAGDLRLIGGVYISIGEEELKRIHAISY